MTNDPKVVLEEVLNSFASQHNTEDEELSAYTEKLISHLTKFYNQTHRRDMNRAPFTIRELDEVLYKLRPGKILGMDEIPAELYRRLPLNLKRHLAAALWDITIRKTDVPSDWANLVHPLYKKGDWVNPDNWIPIVCTTTEAKLIWTLIIKGAEGSFLFLLVTLALALYIRRTHPDVAPYPLRTTLLAFADDMGVVTATACQPLPTTRDTTRATKMFHVVTNYLEGNQLPVHNVKSAAMVHNTPPPTLHPGDRPMNPVCTATYPGVQEAASANKVTLPPNLIRQLTQTLVIARIVALSTQALAYFLQAVLNAAIGFQTLPLAHPVQMIQEAGTTVQRAWTIHGHRATSLPPWDNEHPAITFPGQTPQHHTRVPSLPS